MPDTLIQQDMARFERHKTADGKLPPAAKKDWNKRVNAYHGRLESAKKHEKDERRRRALDFLSPSVQGNAMTTGVGPGRRGSSKHWVEVSPGRYKYVP